MSTAPGEWKIAGTPIGQGTISFQVYSAKNIPEKLNFYAGERPLVFIENYRGVEGRPSYGTQLLNFVVEDYPQAALAGQMAEVNKMRLMDALLDWHRKGRPRNFDFSNVPFLRLQRPFSIFVKENSSETGRNSYAVRILYPDLSDRRGGVFLNQADIPSDAHFTEWLSKGFVFYPKK